LLLSQPYFNDIKTLSPVLSDSVQESLRQRNLTAVRLEMDFKDRVEVFRAEKGFSRKRETI
jgi:hypothetical protein